MFMLKAALQDLGFEEAIKAIPDKGLRFSPLDNAYSQVWMAINDVDAPYQLNQMDLSDLAAFLNLPRPPLKDDIYDFYRALHEKECEAFVDELARCYQRAGLIDCLVVLFDNHTIPYYGAVAIGKVYHSTRNMPIKGLHLAQLNDINGNFILFKLIPSITDFSDILVELLERMKRVLDITPPLMLVVDREAEALPLFQELDRGGVHFIVPITKNPKVVKEMASIPESEFREDFRENEKIVETMTTLKGVAFRSGVILDKDGKRFGFRTNVPKDKIEDIVEIAELIPKRWRQENKFEELKNGIHGDKLAGYDFIDAPNIHLQKRYEDLQDQLGKTNARIGRREKESEALQERYERKKKVFEDRLEDIDKGLKKLEGNLRKAGERKVFQGRLDKKVKERDACVQKYSATLSELDRKKKSVIEKLKKACARKEWIEEELKNIDLDAEFFQLNSASTTHNIGVKEAMINVNSELTRQVTHDGRPMKIDRAKKVLYGLPGKVIVGSSMKVVEFAPIRNRSLRKRIEGLCDWLNEKQSTDTDGKRLVFKVETT